jgi:guanosine-3',5'-bis(diphosphate) 3'-pyrophosphohydrolase
MKDNNIQTIYQKTIDFAAQKHGNQKMPNGLPYIVHLSNVAMEVFMVHKQKQDFDLELAVQLALLHDILEDTSLSFKELKDYFGNIVAEGVLALTKNDKLDKKDQMDDSLNRILDLGKEVAIVKLCDRITNLQNPPIKWDNTKIKKYYLQAIQITETLKGENDYLDKRINKKIEQYKLYL